MNMIIASDSFKESLSAGDVCRVIGEGWTSVLPDVKIWEIPFSDGGEGLAEVITKASGGKSIRTRVTGPLGEPVDAVWGLTGAGDTAVIEMASASGLMVIPPERRDPFITTTRGTGQLIREVLKHNVKKVILGIGGSGTHDAGMGMARALGVKFLDPYGREVPEGARGLLELARIDTSGIDSRIGNTEFLIACDVNNPLYGPRGAAYVYALQKGAAPQDLPLLDDALRQFAAILIWICKRRRAEAQPAEWERLCF